MMPLNNWDGCYDLGWQGLIVPEAFAHPAKVSRGLIRRIYKHAFEEGWLKHGSVIADPFGGICGTALDAMWNRCHWIGVELEPRFVALGEQNIALWDRKFGNNAGWGTARIVQGDSRNLQAVIQGADCVISSPPYVSGGHHPDQTGAWGGQAQSVARDMAGYGSTEGQLGRMKEGTPPSVEMIVGSPPFCESVSTMDKEKARQYSGWAKNLDGSNRLARSLLGGGYGHEPGQLGAMPEGKFDAVISSPPFEKSLLTTDSKFIAQVELDQRNGSRLQGGNVDGYGEMRHSYRNGEQPACLSWKIRNLKIK